jgi:DMSO/TMAO reductase YedYZ heme-binding membrane subunit
VPTSTGRSRGRQGVRAGAQGAGGEHVSKIMTSLIAGAVVIILVLVMTKQGRDIDAATQRFMLYYAGVFALIGLTASVGVGLVATDRIVMNPGHRVMAQAVHRAVSFGALAFLIIHIVTEILAQRVHVIDAFIPFLSPFRTFYIGLGTIASDLILLIVITSVLRKRFTAHGKAWRWRAIHYSSYVAFVFGVLHGLLGGRTAKPYVDWSYGFAIALTALALVVRFLAISLRSKETLSAPPGADRASGGLGYSGTSPLRTAALRMAQAQLGGAIQVLPATGAQGVGPATMGAMGSGRPWAALPPPPGWSAVSGPLPALSAGPAPAGDSSAGFPPLGAPAYADPPRSALTGPGGAGWTGRQPLYEPGYDGPPRFEGAPRKHVPQDDLSSYPYASGPMSRPGPGPASRPGGAPMPRTDTGPMPRADTGPMPRLGSGPMPRPDSRALPRANTGPMPRANTGPMPRADSGPMPRLGTGPMPRADSGPMPRLAAGPKSRANTGPMPRADSGPMPGLGTGPMPRANTGPMPRANTGPMPRANTSPMPRADSGPMPGLGTGPMPRADSGPMPRADSGPMPGLGPGPMPRTDAGPALRPGTGPTWAGNGPAPRPGSGPDPHAVADRRSRADARHRPAAGPDPLQGPRTGAMPQTATRPRRRTGATDPRHRDVPGHAGGDEWR